MVTLERHYPLDQVNKAMLQAVSKKKAHEDGFLSDNGQNTAWPSEAVCFQDVKQEW